MKPREFWLPLNTLIINSDIDRPEGIHVIEYSAVENLHTKIERLEKALHLAISALNQIEDLPILVAIEKIR